MALKFLNKKGWHTGSLRNIENVWKAEQKHDAEQKKLEELRKQIQEEREKSEFRLLQEQAGLVPRQERLDFLYDSGLAVGKGNSDGFKALESYPKTEAVDAAPSSSKPQSSTPGALFEEKPQSANDAWRKLHSDPLLLIRQREQEALARIKNNPVQMANIRKSMEEKKKTKVKSGKKKKHEKLDRKNVKHEKGQSSDEDYISEKEDGKKRSHRRDRSDSETEEKRKRKDDRYLSSKGEWLEGDDASDGEERKRRSHHSRSYVKDSSSKGHKLGDDNASEGEERKERIRHNDRKRHDHYSSNGRSDSETEDRRKRDYNRYSSSKGEISGKDAERNQRSRHQDDKKLDRDALNGKSGLEREEKSREKSKHERYSTQMTEAPKTNSERSYQRHPDSETEERRKGDYNRYSSSKSGISGKDAERNQSSRHQDDRKLERYPLNGKSGSEGEEKSWEKSKHERHSTQMSEVPETNLGRSHPRQRRPVTKLSEEEKAARLREMQMDALVHEEQRWKRLKKASENDAQEANQSSSLGGQNFLSAAQKSVYGAEKGGSSTIEESVRRRKYYSQGRSESNEGNAFRR